MTVAGSLPHWTIWAIVAAILAAAAVVFWPLVGVSVLAASVAVVLFPLQRRLSRRTNPIFAATTLTIVVGAGLVGAAVGGGRGAGAAVVAEQGEVGLERGERGPRPGQS